MLKSVLVAGNDAETRSKFSEILFSIGHKVGCVPGGDEIFVRLQTEKPHLLILEQDLVPEANFTTLEKVIQFNKEIKIVFLTKDNPSTDTVSKIQSLGALGVLKKDFSSHFMFKVILEIIREPDEKIEENKYFNLGKLVVVDDTAAVRLPLKTFLKFRGLDVKDVAEGKQVLTEIKNERPKLILLDVRMPEMDGLMVLNKIKEFDNSIKVVMLSGIHDEEIIEEARKLGACDFIAKPFDFKKLEALVFSILISK